MHQQGWILLSRTLVLTLILALVSNAQGQNTKVEQFPGKEFWSAFDGPPISGGVLYQKNGISLTAQVIKGEDPFGNRLRSCERERADLPHHKENLNYYYVRFTLSNGHPFKTFRPRHIPTVDISLGDLSEDPSPGLCDNCACSGYNYGISGVVQYIVAGESLTWDDHSHGLWMFESAGAPKIYKYKLGAYQLEIPSASSSGGGANSKSQKLAALEQAAKDAEAKGNYKQARDFWEEAKTYSENPSVQEQQVNRLNKLLEQRAKKLLSQAELSIEAGENGEALSYLVEAMNIDPDLNELLQTIRKVERAIDEAQNNEASFRDIMSNEEESEEDWMNDLEGDIASDFEATDSDSEADEQAFNQRSRSQAGDLIETEGGTSNSYSKASGNSTPAKTNNYNAGKCFTLSNRLNEVLADLHQAESELWRASGNQQFNRIEGISKKVIQKQEMVMAVSKLINEARARGELSPECLEEMDKLRSQYMDSSMNEAERELNRLQRKMPNLNEYRLPRRN